MEALRRVFTSPELWKLAIKIQGRIWGVSRLESMEKSLKQILAFRRKGCSHLEQNNETEVWEWKGSRSCVCIHIYNFKSVTSGEKER